MAGKWDGAASSAARKKASHVVAFQSAAERMSVSGKTDTALERYKFNSARFHSVAATFILQFVSNGIWTVALYRYRNLTMYCKSFFFGKNSMHGLLVGWVSSPHCNWRLKAVAHCLIFLAKKIIKNNSSGTESRFILLTPTCLPGGGLTLDTGNP